MPRSRFAIIAVASCFIAATATAIAALARGKREYFEKTFLPEGQGKLGFDSPLSTRRLAKIGADEVNKGSRVCGCISLRITWVVVSAGCSPLSFLERQRQSHDASRSTARRSPLGYCTTICTPQIHTYLCSF